jgi:pyruvate formate lyase activating enzyme
MPEASSGLDSARPKPTGEGGAPPIKGFIETSFLDWPGKMAAVVFLPGCNFACPFCHNFGLVSDPDQFVTLELADVLDRLSCFTGWIDGVVISGGEPTLHPGLADMCRSIKQTGFQVKLDTNGHRPNVVKSLLDQGLVDHVAMDVKAPLKDMAYRRAAGKVVDLDRIRESIGLIIASGVPHEFRSTITPDWHGEDELADMGRSLAGARRWTLQAMNPDNGWDRPVLDPLSAYMPEDIARLQSEIADPACKLGG